ncbi:MAG TPA: AlpA family phage regulatory protein [Ottowia sp.]|uniref:helix-turn-helix transcriptional regulator n=1 Tax=Ottowia sp. TaxID=1898956 RepID=UPI002C4D85FE|nr:AlpA family phage regulatory protein [Ottowia sp.]HMN20580.1 AlpA family phage regulatory protein [Ottowia sp.]
MSTFVTPDPGSVPDRFLSIADVREMTNLSASTIYELIGAGKFPPQIKLTGRRSVWSEGAIQAWMRARAAASIAGSKAHAAPTRRQAHGRTVGAAQ